MNYSRVIQFQRNTYLRASSSSPPPLPLPASSVAPILPSRKTCRINYSRVGPFLSRCPGTDTVRRKNAYACIRTHRREVTLSSPLSPFRPFVPSAFLCRRIYVPWIRVLWPLCTYPERERERERTYAASALGMTVTGAKHEG